MSSFGDFFTSGNIKVAANRIASSFSDTSHDYRLTYDEITKEMASNATSAKNSHFVQLVIDNKIKNLEELTCLYLNTFIGPENTSFKQTKLEFEEEVRRCLKTEGIPEEYISGDNTHLTEQNYSALPNLSKAEAKPPFQNKNKEKKLKFSVIFLTLITLALLGSHIKIQQSLKKPSLLETSSQLETPKKLKTPDLLNTPKQLGKPDKLETPEHLELIALAQSGDVKSQYALGAAYEKGNGIQQNDQEAVKWYRKAAEGGYSAAQHKLGAMYHNGRGLSKNYEESFKWFHKASKNGRKDSQFNLGLHYYHGRGVVEDKELSAYWYNKSALQGESKAQYNLAFQYLHGQGVIKNEETAEYWIRKSAAQGLAISQVALGDVHRLINARLPKERRVTNDFVKAKDWYRKAAEQGDAEGQFKLSQMDSKRYGAVVSEEEAFVWLVSAAELGHKRAQLSLGYLYAEGRGLPKRDDEIATYWYRKAAEQGYSPGQNELGQRYAKGLGAPQNDAKAAYWFRKAIEQGNPEAERRLQILLGD